MRYLLLALILGLIGACNGDGDRPGTERSPAVTSDSSWSAHPGPPVGHVQPTPIPAPAPTSPPTPGQTDAPEPPVPVPQPVPAPEREPEGAIGETVGGVTLTFYTCVGDSTGAYCGTMASGQPVHRGAAACGYAWEMGQRFRILRDPNPGTIYTCLDRGGGPNLWVDLWFYDVTEGRAWRNQLPRYVTVELLN